MHSKHRVRIFDSLSNMQSAACRAFAYSCGWHRLPDSARQAGRGLCVPKAPSTPKGTPGTVVPCGDFPTGPDRGEAILQLAIR
jgi:hypothetical protein